MKPNRFVFFCLTSSLLLFAGGAGAAKQAGGVFPRMAAETLSGNAFAFPDSFEHRFNFLVLGFGPHHEEEAASWYPALERAERQRRDLRYYVVPALEDRSSLGRWFIDQSMRMEFRSRSERDRIVTLYLDRQELMARLGLSDLGAVRAFLVDRRGRILWRGEGSYSDEAWAQVQDHLQ